MAGFRWILAGLGLLLISGIWWWGSRRSSQAPGNPELRETTARDTNRPEIETVDAEPRIEAREWEVSPFEPLNIKTGGFEEVPILDQGMMVDLDVRQTEPKFLEDADTIPNWDLGPVMPPVLTNSPAVSPVDEVSKVFASSEAAAASSDATLASSDATLASSDASPASSSTTPLPDTDRIAVQAPRKPNRSEKQKIVSVRVCAPAQTRWPGAALLSALELHGLAHGRYQVFHRRHVDGRSVFCVASLIEPGVFDIARMPAQEFKGITLFAVLPGPVDALLTLDEMLSAARELAGALPGTVQDAKGEPLSAKGFSALREDVALFQASLPAFVS